MFTRKTRTVDNLRLGLQLFDLCEKRAGANTLAYYRCNQTLINGNENNQLKFEFC
jgi:hypothetical protein